MSDAYREHPTDDALGEPDRESAAITAFGTWRDRVRMLMMLAFAVPGIGIAAIVWYFVQEYQFTHNYGRALLIVNVGSAAIAFGVMFFLGAFLGRVIVRQRTPQMLEQLAKQHEVSPAKLQETANMVNKL